MTLPRTNNDLERWHNRFAGAFTNRHSNVWKFICAKDDSSLNQSHDDGGFDWSAITTTEANIPTNKSAHTYVVANYRNDNIINFLRGISYNLA